MTATSYEQGSEHAVKVPVRVDIAERIACNRLPVRQEHPGGFPVRNPLDQIGARLAEFVVTQRGEVRVVLGDPVAQFTPKVLHALAAVAAVGRPRVGLPLRGSDSWGNYRKELGWKRSGAATGNTGTQHGLWRCRGRFASPCRTSP